LPLLRRLFTYATLMSIRRALVSTPVTLPRTSDGCSVEGLPRMLPMSPRMPPAEPQAVRSIAARAKVAIRI
jgi:hypothetical protein